MTKPSRLMEHFATAAVMTGLALLLSWTWHPVAAWAQDCVGPSQRPVVSKVVNIHNNSEVTIYPVLETAKQDILDQDGRPHDRWLQAEFNPALPGGAPGTYASTYLYRVYINPLKGLERGESVSLVLPFYSQLVKTVCPFSPDQYINWWRALRIIVYDDLGAIQHAYETDQTGAVPVTLPKGSDGPSCATCVGSLVIYRDQSGGDRHGVSLPPGDPSQLLEFTFATVTAAPLPLDIDHGFVDYDISSVDQVYLPVAMDPVDNPYIGFIGSVLGRKQFSDRLEKFRTDFGWPKYRWPSYVTNQDNIRLPATYNVMKEIAVPGAPPPFDPSGDALRDLPVIEAMDTLWTDCCGSEWPASASCRKLSSSETCVDMAKVADLFEKNHAQYAKLCAKPDGLTRDSMMAQVYGWVPFNSCPTDDGHRTTVVNELKDTPGFSLNDYHAVANAYIDLQYHAPGFNRYVDLIHDVKYLRVGEYAFSIDDAAGNMLEVGDGVNITIGGAAGLANRNPYDPWRFFMFNPGAARLTGALYTKYRVCTKDDGPACPSAAPDRPIKEAVRRNDTVGYAGIKIGAVNCPCVVVLQDSRGSLYKVQINSLPAPPPVHAINEQGDAPTANDPGWTRKDGDTYANVGCFDTGTNFEWCRLLTPDAVFDAATGRTAYHVNTTAPVEPSTGIRFEKGSIVGVLSADRKVITVTWPKAVTQPPNRPVKYELTLWDLSNCPPQGSPCDGHSFIPLGGTCNTASTQCQVTLSRAVGQPGKVLTADTLKSLSVVASDPDGHIAAKQANFTAPVNTPKAALRRFSRR